MIKQYFYIAMIVVMMMLASCKEVFYPDEILTEETIPVMVGGIHEGESPEVQLSWASNFGEDRTDYIYDATVWITDDAGNNEPMEVTNLGIYVPVNENYIGIRGRTYTLHVETAEGDLYESTPELIRSTAQLDSISAVAVDRTRLIRTGSGNLFPRPEEGLDVDISVNKETDSTSYFKFDTDILIESVYFMIDSVNPDSVINGYIWESTSKGNFYDVRFTYQDEAKQVVPEQFIGFLEFIYDPWLATEFRSAPAIFAWVVSVNVYSISGEVYAYYNSVEELLNGEDRIFGPVPAQLRSNMICVNDVDKQVMGVFEATSKITFHKAFQWLGQGRFKGKDLDSFPQDLGMGDVLGEPPDFWISF